MTKFIFLIILTIICGQFLSCANRVFPSGGEGRKIPPQVLSVLPENNSLNVNPRTKIQIRFSEWINPKSIESGITISPHTEFSFKVNARNVVITPKTPLKANTSYHISFLGDIADFNGNSLLETQTIIFSTGDFIDTSFIEGRIFFENTDTLLPKVALFFAERAEQSDTILLSNPDYITQADSNGFFRFNNIANEKYRVIGFLDRNRDNRITPREPVFLGVEKVVETQSFQNLFPATSDTVQNIISSVSAFSPTVLSMKLRFATETRPFENIRITNGDETVRIERIQRHSDNQTIAVFLRDSLQNRQYIIETRAQRIVANAGDSIFLDTIRFNGTTLVDTVNLSKLDSLFNFQLSVAEPVEAVEADTSAAEIAVCPRLSWNFIGELPANPLWELINEKGVSIFTTNNFVENIPAGRYRIALIDDRNRNEKYDIGTLFPFVAGEKRIMLPDILVARERWEVEYDIALPKKIPDED